MGLNIKMSTHQQYKHTNLTYWNETNTLEKKYQMAMGKELNVYTSPIIWQTNSLFYDVQNMMS